MIHFHFSYIDGDEDENDIDNNNYIELINEFKYQRNPIIRIYQKNNEIFIEESKEDIYINGYSFSTIKDKNSLEVKNLNNNLNEEIINLKNELEIKNKIIKEQKEKITNLESQNNFINLELNNAHIKIENLQKQLKLKEQELIALKNELNNKNEELKKLKIKDINKEKYSKKDGIDLAINFMLVGQDILYPIPCRFEDTIVKLEEELYNEYPKYKDYNTYLTVNGKKVKRFKTIEENGIKKGNVIKVNIYEK